MKNTSTSKDFSLGPFPSEIELFEKTGELGANQQNRSFDFREIKSFLSLYISGTKIVTHKQFCLQQKYTKEKVWKKFQLTGTNR